jgi:hypothetical protein
MRMSRGAPRLARTTAAAAIAAACFHLAVSPAAAQRHPHGGGPRAAIFGDSADHTRHNIVNVTVVSAAVWGVLWLLPAEYTEWYKDKPTLRGFTAAYSRPPVWDTDRFVWNWIGHPFVGMQTYLMERNWGRSQLRSFLFATGASVAWEYGFEAWMEHPSIQDLIVTGPGGWVLGEASYRLTQRMRRGGFSTTEKVIVLVVNPLHVLQHGFR